MNIGFGYLKILKLRFHVGVIKGYRMEESYCSISLCFKEFQFNGFILPTFQNVLAFQRDTRQDQEKNVLVFFRLEY